jgi:hypothetical protein
MEEFIAQALKLLNGDPRHLGDVFGQQLTQRDELLLTKIDQELGCCVEGILDKVLAGANVQGEMKLSQSHRDSVMEITAIRRAIYDLILNRGTLRHCRQGLN